LSEIAAKVLPPAMDAFRLAAEHQPVAPVAEAVAQVVVVPITQSFVEEPGLVQRGSAVGGIACADVVDTWGPDARIPVLEIPAHGACPESGARRRHVVSLDGGDLRIVQRLDR